MLYKNDMCKLYANIPVNSHVSKHHRSSLKKTKGEGREESTVIDICQSLREARSDCSWYNYEGRRKKGD